MGDGVVKQLADYIERTSPETKGFSDKNLLANEAVLRDL